MNEDQVSRIFKKNAFIERDQENNDQKGDVGIGSYLTIKILEKINGKDYFLVESVYQVGSRIAFLLIDDRSS